MTSFEQMRAASVSPTRRAQCAVADQTSPASAMGMNRVATATAAERMMSSTQRTNATAAAERASRTPVNPDSTPPDDPPNAPTSWSISRRAG